MANALAGRAAGGEAGTPDGGTPLRMLLLDVLRGQTRPAKAYALLDALSQRLGRRVSPPTVYRTLDWLVAAGFAVRIERRDAYVASRHAGSDEDRLFLLCSRCGGAEEMLDRRLAELLATDARAAGFSVARSVVEVEGTCRDCAAEAGRAGAAG